MLRHYHFQKYALSALVKALIGTFLFLLIYLFSNTQLVKIFAEDVPFDLLHKVILESDAVEVDAPNVMVFGLDDVYLKNEGLLDEHNQSHYGDFLPRDKIASFIKKLDLFIEGLDENKRPLALFLDYDFSFTSSAYNVFETKEDQALIETLKAQRSYKILIPKNKTYNYIESSKDKKIQALIARQNIVFVSVDLAQSKEFVTKRYVSFSTYRHSVTDKNQSYVNVSVALWQLAKDKNVSIEAFSEQNVVQNRIIIKAYEKSSLQESSSHKQSKWKNFNYYSADYPLNSIVSERFENSLLLLGDSSSASSDVFNVPVTANNGRLSGVEVHAHTLMTLFYVDGSLKSYGLVGSLLFLFILFFLIDFFINILFLKFQITKFGYQLMISLFMITFFMFLFSWIVMLVYQEWFNWFIAVLLFEAIEGLEFLERRVLHKN